MTEWRIEPGPERTPEQHAKNEAVREAQLELMRDWERALLFGTKLKHPIATSLNLCNCSICGEEVTA